MDVSPWFVVNCDHLLQDSTEVPIRQHIAYISTSQETNSLC